MELKNISRKLVIAGAIIIWAIKYFIRPYGEWQQPTLFLLGIAPNLLGSFLIPFGACWFFSGKDHLLAKIFRINSSGNLLVVCCMGFGMLVINEYLQMIPFFGRTFDYWDIVFSAIGLAISYWVYSRLFSKMIYRFYPD